MGKSYSEPKFFELDYSRIKIISASKLKDFSKYNVIMDFGKERGKAISKGKRGK